MVPFTAQTILLFHRSIPSSISSRTASVSFSVPIFSMSVICSIYSFVQSLRVRDANFYGVIIALFLKLCLHMICGTPVMCRSATSHKVRTKSLVNQRQGVFCPDLFPRPFRDTKGSVRDSNSGLGPSVVIPHVKRQFDVQKAPQCVRTSDAL